MKITTFMLFIALMQASASGLAQQITLHEKNADIKTVLRAIEQQSGYVFLYDSKDIGNQKITIEVKNATVEETLEKCFKDLPLEYKVVDKNIILQQKEPTILGKIKTTLAIPITVSGKVVDEQNKPLPGVSIRFKGTSSGTVTDEKGAFSFTVPDKNTILIFSFIGFETQEIAAKDLSDPVLITLKASSTNLKEVVVNKGYYNTTQELNTGDVSSVSAKEIEEQPVSNPLAALEGRVPGLIITQQSGVPGSAFNVQIRGQNSIANGNYPFYVVDGVPYTSQLLLNLGNIINYGSPLSYINPSDIENIDILKDADATAIYGSRGANGVILITTKKGKAGKTKFDVIFYQGEARVTNMEDQLNTQQYLEMRNEAFKNDGITPSSYDYDVNGTWDKSSYTNWSKLLIGGTAHYTDIQGSLSGGDGSTQFLISGGFHRETTVFPGDLSDQKGSVHLNVNHTSPDQKFKVILMASYTADNSNLIYNDLTGQTSIAPDAPNVYNPDGSINWANGTFDNPLAYLLQTYNSRTDNLITNVSFSYKLLSNLEAKVNTGYSNMQVGEVSTAPIASFNPAYNIITGSSGFVNNNIQTWIVEPQISYNTIIGKGKLSALMGSTIQSNTSNNQSLNASGYTSDGLLGSIGAAAYLQGTNNVVQYKYNAIFGRLSYDWQEKYVVNFTLRRDGSSRFGPGRQFANFGALGAAWIFSNEDFIRQRLPFLSFGKLRGSYGITGNDQIPDYGYLSLYNSTTYPYQGTQGLFPSNLYNPDFAWEINKKLEAGFELGFVKDRILFNVSFYRNISSNQLVGRTLPEITGFTTVTENLPATVENKGVEISLNTTNVKSKEFTWSSMANFTMASNKLVSFPNFIGSGYDGNYVIGQPLSIVKVYHLIGVNSSTGVYQFSDSQGNPTYNPSYTADRTVLINTAPKFYGGLRNSFQYKEFQLDIFFQFVKQIGRNDLFNNFHAPGMALTNQPAAEFSRWQKAGDIAPFEQYTTLYGTAFQGYNSAQISDAAYSDASFIRLKNLSVSYQLPEIWKQKIHVQNCKIYIQGQNLLTITHYMGIDPENLNSGVLPPLKVLTVGIQVTL